MQDTATNYLIPRHLSSVIEESLKSFKCLYLVGMRQVGKTTLVRDLLPTGNYITFDNQQLLNIIRSDPNEHLRSLLRDDNSCPLVMDEFQFAPELALPIKMILDSNPSYGQLILTGSSNIFLSAKSTDSLVGRIMPIDLWPLTTSELKKKKPSRLFDWAIQKGKTIRQFANPESLNRKNYVDLILRGGLPAAYNLSLKHRQSLYQTYVKTVIERDLRSVAQIHSLGAFRKLIQQMAVRTGQEVNLEKMRKPLNVSWSTASSYIDIMERLSLVIRLGEWSSRESKRDIKSPKYHFVDTGMVCAIRAFNEDSFSIQSSDISQFGGLLETFVFNELLRVLPYQSAQFHLYHWRSADGKEIDILAKGANQFVGIEIKSSSIVNQEDFRHLNWFAENNFEKSRPFTGIVFYLGDTAFKVTDNCYALPVSSLWSEISF